jgi:hypothetical protein
VGRGWFVADDEPQPQPDERQTYDPHRSAIWPTSPPGTRLPVRPVARWKDMLGLIFILLVLAGMGVLVWWFIETVRSR